MDNLKLFITPEFKKPDKGDGGIRRVTKAMRHYLPNYGIDIVDSVKDADILNYHAGAYAEYKDKPMVSSCHGLYWTNYKWEEHYHRANQSIIEIMSRSQAVTVPSNWVGNAIARGILHQPKTIYHGVDNDFWAPVPTTRKNHNYVLWNKARADIISNPNDLIEIAAKMKNVQFITTIGRKTENVNVMGVVPYNAMVGAIKDAGVYLCTARETFGIGTLEALSAGVPVAGWDFGGQSEIVKQGETGYLAPYGDYEALQECINNCLLERHRLSENARKDAVTRWGWEDKIKQYADLFQEVYTEWNREGPKFSIIVPCHNLGKYLPAALDSVNAQTVDDWECIIIDDDSTDTTELEAMEYTKNSGRFIYHKTPHNAGLCNVRNLGYKMANGRYILYLDADDMITPEALETLGAHLDGNPGAQIAYGKLDFVNEKGEGYREGDPPPAYNWVKQMCHYHQFPIGASLIRRDVLKRSGGFRVRDWRAEDAAWISRVTSFGVRASKATDNAILVYRLRSDSKSQQEAREHPNNIDGNWLAWLGWHVAPTRKEGYHALKAGKKPPWYLTPFGAQSQPIEPPHFNTDHHQDPLVSVIIPVGPGHQDHLIDALDSLIAQTVPYWEAIVVNDTGHDIDTSYAPWAKVITTEGQKGAGYARNRGSEAAAAPLLYFLDSDDWLLSGGLDAMVRAWLENEGRYYIYSNYLDINANGKLKPQRMKTYDQKQWKCQHAVNILINADEFWKVGGYDEDLIGWEDWDLPIKLAISGLCGHHIADQTFIYRIYSGKRRETAVSKQSELLEVLKARYGPYYQGGGLKMAKCCGGSNAAQSILKARASYGDMAAANALLSMTPPSVQRVESVRMEFVGLERGAISFIRVSGKPLTKTYKGAATPTMKYINAHPQDVKLLESTGKWRQILRARRQTSNLPAPRPPVANVDPAPRPPQPLPEPDAATPAREEVSITIAARRLAESNGIDFTNLKGTGKNGKITLSDIRGTL